MEAGHPFIDCSKRQRAKQLSPISSQPRPSMVRRSSHSSNAYSPIFLTSSIPRRESMPESANARNPTVVTAESLRKLRLLRPVQPWNAYAAIVVTPSATVASATCLYNSNSSSSPVYMTVYMTVDISEEQGGRGAEGVDAVEREASRGTQRWVGGAR
jgi:hypothetical protein